MSSKLKIYMCSGVGKAKEEYEYWLDGTNTATNTRAVNTLLAMINELCTELDFLNLTKEQQLEHYNRIDLLVVALQFAKRGLSDNELARAGRIIQEYIDNGKFNYSETQDDSRSHNLDALFDSVNAAFGNGADPKSSGVFNRWWVSDILPNNRQGVTPEQQRLIEAQLKKQSVGATEDDFTRAYGDIGKYLYNSSEYFLYLFIPTDSASRLPLFLRKKIEKQRECYEYVARVFDKLYGSREDMQRIIRSRIIAQSGKTPEECVSVLLKSRGVGLATEAIIMIVIAAAALAAAILSALLQVVQNVLVAKYAIPENIDDGCPEETDWNLKQESKSKIIKYGLIAAIVYLFIKK